MPRASVMISRTIMCDVQTVRDVDVMSSSTARRAPSVPTLYRRQCAALQAAPASTLPRNPSSNERGDNRQESLSISGDMSWHSGRRQPRRPLAVSGDIAQSKSSTSELFSAQTTIVHPTPARAVRPPRASQRERATPLPFFYPRRDRVARHTEGACQPAQTAAFIVSAQDLFARWCWISIAARLFSTALTALAAQITLASIRSRAVTHQSLALAMLTLKSNSDHC